MISYITVRTSFEAYHRYVGAGQVSEKIKFLENYHRHKFLVSVTIEVSDDDRELEFFLVKWNLDQWLSETFAKSYFDGSCEMVAKNIIISHLLPTYQNNRYMEVSVSEDGENDGLVKYFPVKDL